MKQNRVLIIYYTYSGQTRKVISAFASGMESEGIEVTLQQLRPKVKLSFPLGSVLSTLRMMVKTFFRRRIEIEELEGVLEKEWELIVLAGPTWSYNPSGPVLSFFDNYSSFLSGMQVLPCISCRGYWRTHFYQLCYMLRRHDASVLKPLVFLHTGQEPWRTVGVFMKIAGRMPESGRSWMRRYYPRFGHSREQLGQARNLGERYGRHLAEGVSLTSMGPFLIRHASKPAQK